MTPNEKAGIKIEDDNKWVTLIQNSKKSRSPNFTGENRSL